MGWWDDDIIILEGVGVFVIRFLVEIDGCDFWFDWVFLLLCGIGVGSVWFVC